MSTEPLPTLIFYEKPGCASNAKQKAQLKAVGFTLDVRNLLTEAWTAQTLGYYFKSLPVAEWFNKSAPKVKEGLINPADITAQQAFALMLQEPLLIRRPLIRNAAAADINWVGFDLTLILADLGLPADLASDKPLVSEACTGSSVRCETHADTELKQQEAL
ncbi:MAG TPA: ArsC/Spx/MgsR family protein [Cellvibrionaceae bacterium]|nr:ArsC/Spx/MgsR family protein [Cellvibrionaceae bacterium]